MKQNTDERRRKIDEMRERFAPLRDYMAQHRKETLELMHRRHAYYTKLITDAGIKTAEELYGIKLKLSDNNEWCSIYLELGDYDYEDYGVEDGKDDTLAEVNPEVPFTDMFNNVEVNIFTGEEL